MTKNSLHTFKMRANSLMMLMAKMSLQMENRNDNNKVNPE